MEDKERSSIEMETYLYPPFGMVKIAVRTKQLLITYIHTYHKASL